MMIKKEVTGNAADLKLVDNSKNAPVAPMGGTNRTSFAGSNDTRPAGNVNSNKKLKDAPGYVDQGPVSHDHSDNHGAKFVNGGPDNGPSMSPVFKANNSHRKF